MKKLSFVVLLLVITGLIITGCDQLTSDSGEPGQLHTSVNLSEDINSENTIISVLNSELKENQMHKTDKTGQFDEVFDNLSTGNWEVELWLQDETGIYHVVEQEPVEIMDGTTAEIELELSQEEFSDILQEYEKSENNISLTQNNELTTQDVDNGDYRIISEMSDKALQIEDASTEGHASVVQWEYQENDNQQWWIEEVEEGNFQIINNNSELAMEVIDAETDNGSDVVQWEYNGHECQQWEIAHQGDGLYSIINVNSGKSLDVYDYSTEDGGNIVQWDYWGGETQQFAIEAVDGSGDPGDDDDDDNGDGEDEVFEIDDPAPSFSEVSVHDPMAYQEDETYWVFGSHLASAYSDNLTDWNQYSSDWDSSNPLIPNPEQELEEALTWPNPDAESTWAKSIIELNGQYYMYFSSANWDSTRSCIALATSDSLDGPYEYEDILIRKYENGEYSEETGETYDESIHPGVIDPHVFFDESDNLWMVYGSYSGGIFIIELDPSTGYPLPDQGYGTRIAGGDHAPMEGPNIHYSSETGYYYLFLSFGKLDTEGGYNIRVARSENPDGPYYDPSGNNMLEATGDDWDAVERYGAKLIGNFEFSDSNIDYVSPGHNSVLMGDKNYIFFHTRFNDGTEDHEVRVHQLYMNSEGWPVIAPHRYGGETIQSYSDGEIAGSYQLINHGKEISSNINSSITIELSSDGNIAGDASGNWSRNGNDIELTIDGTTYNGILTHNWDDGLQNWVITFSALSQDGVTIWGSQK